jgi:hypothetical protein
VSKHRPQYQAGYVATALLLGHALMSRYWAICGMLGMGLLAEGILELAKDRETWYVALL